MGERVASWFAILMLAIVLASSYWYGRSLHEPEAGDSGRIGQVDFFAEQIALTGFDALGRGHYRLFADRMTHYAASDDVDLTNPHLLSLRTDQPQLQTTSLTGHLYDNGQTVRLDGDVVVTRAPDGTRPSMRLETQQLFTVPDDDRFWTDRPVRMTSGGARMNGVGMDFDNLTRHMVLRAKVDGVFPPRREP